MSAIAIFHQLRVVSGLPTSRPAEAPQLHRLVDQLPDHALEHAGMALKYCNDPEKHRMTIKRCAVLRD